MHEIVIETDRGFATFPFENGRIVVDTTVVPHSLRRSDVEQYAKENGVGVFVRYDGAAVILFLDDGRIRRRTYKNARFLTALAKSNRIGCQ